MLRYNDNEARERAIKQRVELKLNEAYRAITDAFELSIKVEGMIGGDRLVRSLAEVRHTIEREKQRTRNLGTGAAVEGDW